MSNNSFSVQVALDGDQWCALVGDDLQTGTAGFGDSISDALHQLAFAIERQGLKEAPIPKLTIDDELLDKVNRYLAIKPLTKECESLNKLLRASFEGEPLVELGMFDIYGKYITKPEWTGTIKASTYWKMDIKPNPERVALVKR